jgi:hypothetical protein
MRFCFSQASNVDQGGVYNLHVASVYACMDTPIEIRPKGYMLNPDRANCMDNRLNEAPKKIVLIAECRVKQGDAHDSISCADHPQMVVVNISFGVADAAHPGVRQKHARTWKTMGDKMIFL